MRNLKMIKSALEKALERSEQISATIPQEELDQFQYMEEARPIVGKYLKGDIDSEELANSINNDKVRLAAQSQLVNMIRLDTDYKKASEGILALGKNNGSYEAVEELVTKTIPGLQKEYNGWEVEKQKRFEGIRDAFVKEVRTQAETIKKQGKPVNIEMSIRASMKHLPSTPAYQELAQQDQSRQKIYEQRLTACKEQLLGMHK